MSLREYVGQHTVSPKISVCLQTEPGQRWQDNELAVYGCSPAIGRLQDASPSQNITSRGSHRTLSSPPHPQVSPLPQPWVFRDKKIKEAIRRITPSLASILEKPTLAEVVY